MDGFTLEEYRRAKGISKEAMASELGIHPNTYTHWEDSPEENITISNGIKISKILNVPFEKIFLISQSTY